MNKKKKKADRGVFKVRTKKLWNYLPMILTQLGEINKFNTNFEHIYYIILLSSSSSSLHIELQYKTHSKSDHLENCFRI